MSGMGLSAAVRANPLLLIVTVVALAKAFHTARRSADWRSLRTVLLRVGYALERSYSR